MIPVNPGGGVKITLVPPGKVAVPLVVTTLVIVSRSPSGSLSLVRGSKVIGVLAGVDTTSFTAIGKRLVTLIVIKAEFVPPLPSLIEYPTVASPLKLGAGEKIILVPPRMVAVPLVG